VYPSPPSRRIGPGLIVVLLLLAGVAGAGGYLGTRRILVDQAGGSGSTSSPSATPAPTPTVVVPDITGDPKDPATFCPAVTEKAVTDAGLAGELQLLRYVTAKGKNGEFDAEAWVCQNADRVLIYQGHRKSGPFTEATSNHTLLLASGIRGRVTVEGTGFVATNPKNATNPDDPEHTDYHVSATEFYLLQSPSGVRIDYTITRTVP
jgi:hypothetical protein